MNEPIQTLCPLCGGPANSDGCEKSCHIETLKMPKPEDFRGQTCEILVIDEKTP